MLPVEAARQIAIARHVKLGQFEIDPDSEAQVTEKGVWIQAWVLVTHKDINDALECVA